MSEKGNDRANRDYDRLEQFILDHRDEFDHLRPPGRELASPWTARRRGDGQWWWKAAAVIFFALSTFLIFERVSNSDVTKTVSNGEPEMAEFHNAESYYTNIIDVKRQELVSALKSNEELSDDFIRDLAELDSIYAHLKTELRTNTDEKVVDAILLNLQTRIEILDRQLQIAKEIQKSANTRQNEVSI